jgi:hypothetical protein
MTKQTSTAVRKFHFMVAAQIVFNITLDSGEQAVNTANINSVVTHDKDMVPARLLGKAQQAAQMQLFNKLGEEATKINVVDVVILNLMNLGYMTDEEFQATPDGTVKKEVSKPGLKVVKSAANEEAIAPAATLEKLATGTLQ